MTVAELGTVQRAAEIINSNDARWWINRKVAPVTWGFTADQAYRFFLAIRRRVSVQEVAVLNLDMAARVIADLVVKEDRVIASVEAVREHLAHLVGETNRGGSAVRAVGGGVLRKAA